MKSDYNYSQLEVDLDKLGKLNFILDLKRQVVGAKFLYVKEEYDACSGKSVTNKNTFCRMVALAMEGQNLKLTYDNFSCQGGPETLGLTPVSSYVKSGNQFSTFKLYQDRAVAKKAQDSISFLNQKIYGIQLAPLTELRSPDVVMIICNAWQMMRLVQGYSYKYAMPRNIGMMGNQGVCSDLCARPFATNDINVSALCLGARMQTQADDGELGVGMPLNIFVDTLDGVLKTFNPATEDRRKKIIQNHENGEEKLGFDIEFGKTYSSYAQENPIPVERYKEELF